MAVNLPNHTASDLFWYQYEQSSLDKNLTPMDALDLVKKLYAANFRKISDKGSDEIYYYRSEIADYYLAYEGVTKNNDSYLIHLYEFVLDEPETGTGHCVTYGWFTVNKKNGKIETIAE